MFANVFPKDMTLLFCFFIFIFYNIYFQRSSFFEIISFIFKKFKSVSDLSFLAETERFKFSIL